MDQQQTFLVETRTGKFNMLNSRDVAVAVRVLRPGHKHVAFTVSEDHLSELSFWELWSDYLQSACETFLRRYISSQRDEVQALLDWVQDEGNARALDTAQAEHRVSTLRAKIQALEADAAKASGLLSNIQPRVFKDGDAWCALAGENLQEGTAGFGATPSEAFAAYQRAVSESEVA